MGGRGEREVGGAGRGGGGGEGEVFETLLTVTT